MLAEEQRKSDFVKKIILHERLASFVVHSDFILPICLKKVIYFALLMVQSGIYDKSSNSTVTTFCKENGIEQAQPL